MAEVVGIFAATHTPLFLLRRDEPAQEVRDDVFACYEGIGKAMLDRGAEALIVFENDHLHSLFLDRHPSLAVGVQPCFGMWPAKRICPSPKAAGRAIPISASIW